MTAYEIPLTPDPQDFFIQLLGKQLSVSLRWCEPAAAWTIDLKNDDGSPILLGLPLVTGSDLLGQHKHLGIPGSLFVQSDGDIGEVPTFDSLGVSGHLYFVVP
jgi:hypothetical protein